MSDDNNDKPNNVIPIDLKSQQAQAEAAAQQAGAAPPDPAALLKAQQEQILARQRKIRDDNKDKIAVAMGHLMNAIEDDSIQFAAVVMIAGGKLHGALLPASNFLLDAGGAHLLRVLLDNLERPMLEGLGKKMLGEEGA